MLIALVGCSGGDDPVVEEPTTGNDAIPASGITVESPEGLSFAWEEGSIISLFRSKTNEKFVYNSASNEFEKKDKLEKKEPLDANYGVMPYKGTTRVANGEVKMEFPSRQTYAANGVCFAENPMVGVSASASTTDMQFKNLGGYAVVKVYGTAVIKSIAIEGMNGETLAGTAMVAPEVDADPTFSITALPSKTVTVTAETPVELGLTAEEATPFYLMVPPTTFEAGFTVILTDSYGNVRKKNFRVDEENPAVSIARNEVVEIATIELKEKMPTKTILDVQFNEDGTATDEGIYNMDVNLVGDINPYSYVYKHPKFKENNIVRFSHMTHNDAATFSYYQVNYADNEEFKATIADGFSFEVVSLNTAWAYDKWSVPAGADTFHFLRKGEFHQNSWCFTYNQNGNHWCPSGPKINTTLEKNKYVHTVYIYDADNQWIQVYHNGVLLGMAENVAEFNPGSRLTIGGHAIDDGRLYMHWNGEVALVRMYDQPLEPSEVADKFNDLKLPEAPAAPVTSFGSPLFDAQWAADKTATNVGSQSSLEIISLPAGNTEIINVEGFGNIVNFNITQGDIHNRTYKDGFYLVKYGDDEDFKSKLADGFTMEVVCVSNFDQGNFWKRPMTSNKWGFTLKDGDVKKWAIFANSPDNDWWNYGDRDDAGYPIYIKDQVTKMESFAHMVYVYNAETKEIGLYMNGNFSCGKNQGTFPVGSLFSISGMPYTDKDEMAHGWNGKIAIARIYDEAYTQEQILGRYAELQPVIEKLNTTIQ